MNQLEKLKNKWLLEGVNKFSPVTIDALRKFQNVNDWDFPNDLNEYFSQLNGTGGEYTNGLYEFYSVNRIKKVKYEFNDWMGIPNYQALLNLEEIKELFVFANYSFNLFAYAIRPHPQQNMNNEVYVLCGEDYKKISNTFSDFLDLYLSNSVELQLNK
jgi:hypothetical protein